MTYSSEGIKTKGGVIVGYNLDEEYPEEDTSHSADLAEIYGVVTKLPDKLYYNREDPSGMSWDCDMELQIGDLVWFNVIESKNAVEIECESKTYKLIPFSDIYCAKRVINLRREIEFNTETLLPSYVNYYDQEVIMLNGYVLCEQVYTYNDSPLAIKNKTEDRTRGIIRYVGKCNRQYQREEYVDFVDLEVGDLVLFNPGTAPFALERKSYLATFNGDNLYNVVQRRRIALVLSKGN